MRLVLNVILVILAAVYLPLAMMQTDFAREYWWEYALVVFVIAVTDFVLDVYNHLKDDDHA